MNERSTWPLAFALALGAHLAIAGLGFLTLAQATVTAVEDFGAAHAIDFELTPMAIDGDGAADSDSAAAPELINTPSLKQQLSAVAPDEALVAEASPYEPPPELEAARQKTREQAEREPDDAQPTEALEAQSRQQQSQGAQAAIAGGVGDALGPFNAAAADGSSARDVKALESWQRALMAHLGRHKRYPASARAARQEGEPVVRIRLSSAGRVLSAELARPSHHGALDREALELLERAQPLPAPPKWAAVGEMDLTIPIRFVLK